MAGIKLLEKNAPQINYIVNEVLKPAIHTVLFDDFMGLTEIWALMSAPTTIIYGIMSEGKPKPIGIVYFTNTIPYRNCNLNAVIFDPEKRDKGNMTSLVKKIEIDLQKRFYIHSVTAHVVGNNEGSVRFLERLGFTKIGVKEKFICSGGEYRDLAIYYRLLGEEGEGQSIYT